MFNFEIDATRKFHTTLHDPRCYHTSYKHDFHKNKFVIYLYSDYFQDLVAYLLEKWTFVGETNCALGYQFEKRNMISNCGFSKGQNKKKKTIIPFDDYRSATVTNDQC